MLLTNDIWESRHRFESQARRTELQIGGIVTIVTILGLGLWLGLVILIALYLSNLLLQMALGMLLSAVLLYVIQFVIPRWFERKQLKRIAKGEDSAAHVTPYELAHVSLHSVLFPFLFAILFNFLILILPRDETFQLIRVFILIAVLVFGFSTVMFSFVYHHVPNCRRSVKYAAFFAGGILISEGISGVFFLGHEAPSLISWLLATSAPALSGVLFIVMYHLIQPDAALNPGTRSTRRTISLLRWTNLVGPGPGFHLLFFTIIRLIPIVGDLFWAARMWSKERIARRPVLFLRSFSHAGTPALLAKAVAPVLYRTCTLVALVHPDQSSASLNKGTHEAWTPTTIGVSNDRWQEWFLLQLSEALAVVVDASEVTPNLLWEVENSIRLLGADRVVMLVPVGTTPAAPDCVVLEYLRKHPKKIKPALRQWIYQVVRKYLETPPSPVE